MTATRTTQCLRCCEWIYRTEDGPWITDDEASMEHCAPPLGGEVLAEHTPDDEWGAALVAPIIAAAGFAMLAGAAFAPELTRTVLLWTLGAAVGLALVLAVGAVIYRWSGFTFGDVPVYGHRPATDEAVER